MAEVFLLTATSNSSLELINSRYDNNPLERRNCKDTWTVDHILLSVTYYHEPTISIYYVPKY